MSVNRYNPNEREQAFQSFRLTVSNPILIESINNVKIREGFDNGELVKEALIHYLEEKQEIKVSD